MLLVNFIINKIYRKHFAKSVFKQIYLSEIVYLLEKQKSL